MTLFAMAGYRMMPALQQIYIGFSNMRIAKPAIDKIKSDLALPVEEVGLKSLSSDTIELNHQIEFRNVGFSHHGIVDKTVSDLSLMILRGSHVAFVGATGSGKTTVVDLICGLLEQVDGDILIDGKEITARRLKNWQDQIGYVTQSTFLIDDTIAKNVAFGVADEDINLERVKRALLVAQLSDFAQDGNPGLMTIVGERGSRLSGGQIQRIGIARALYRQPKILVLDEATSALDARTERLVIDGIIKAKGSYTIMSIAHRISTVVECDKIFVLDGGCLVGEGTASELIVSSEKFRVLTSPISYQEDQNDKA
jgi:ABC-type multidrug transport system fused ATPase/permease subunit